MKIKVILSANNKQFLSSNSFYKGKFDKNENTKFFLYIPGKGEFRLILENCSNLQIRKATFYPHKLTNLKNNSIDKRNIYRVNYNDRSIDI